MAEKKKQTYAQAIAELEEIVAKLLKRKIIRVLDFRKQRAVFRSEVS